MISSIPLTLPASFGNLSELVDLCVSFPSFSAMTLTDGSIDRKFYGVNVSGTLPPEWRKLSKLKFLCAHLHRDSLFTLRSVPP